MYNVIVLAEQVLSAGDAAELVSLHEAIDEPRHYHLLIPCENAQVRVETALGALAASEVLAAPPVVTDEMNAREAQEAIDAKAANAVTVSVATIRGTGHEASGEFSSDDPVDALEKVASEHGAAEVIVMTRPHVVQEFLHLDWTSRARRRLGVPILHLIEHEPLDGEASTGQGITGM
ncbi:MAG: hypothetical protein H0T17_01000 [Propionibacteriales bacterium]|nr:hypothetical protein [Propionibacteriales bacterium]